MDKTTKLTNEEEKPAKSAKPNDIFSKKDVRKEFNKRYNSRGRGKTIAEKREIYNEYDLRKKAVFEMEKMNTKYLILFLASSGKIDENKNGGDNDEDNYYYMGGNSAMIFATEIGPRIGRRPRILPDNDPVRTHFSGGMVCIRSIKRLEKALAGIDIKRLQTAEQDAIAFFLLPKEYTKDEIKGLAKQQKHVIEEANKLLYPMVLEPRINNMIINIRKMIIRIVKNINHEYRSLICKQTLEPVFKLKDAYTRAIRGTIEEEAAFVEMQLLVDMVADRVGMLQELELIDVLTAIKIGNALATFQEEITMKLNYYRNQKNENSREKPRK